MLITVGEKTIDAKIMANDKADQAFEDAIAGGATAAMVSDARENVDLHQLEIGNILPGEKAIIELQLIQPLKVDEGAFSFKLPLSYFPKYKQSLFAEAGSSEPEIIFNFKAQIKS